MNGSLCTWVWKDCVDEMLVQRKEIGRLGITWNEAEDVRRGATLLVLCCSDEGDMNQMAVDAHLHEISFRIELMLKNNMFAEEE